MKQIPRCLLAAGAIALIFLMPFIPCAWGKGTVDVLPSEFSLGVFLRLRSQDPAIQWILDSYKKNFLSGHVGDKAKAVVEDFSLLELEEASFALFDVPDRRPKMLVVGDIIPTDATLTFKIKKVDFKLKIKERSEEKGLQSAVIKALLGSWVSSPDCMFLDNDVVYSPALEKEGEVCAYSVNKNRIIVANALSLVQGALHSTMEGASYRPSGDLGEFLKRFAWPRDCLIFLDNQTGFMNRLNAQWEKKMQVPLLTNVSSMRCAGIFVDIVDQDHVELEGNFMVRGPNDVPVAKQDLSFLLEYFRRKLLLDGVQSVARMEEQPGGVQVRMSMSNTSGFLTKYLKKDRGEKDASK